MNLEFEFKPDGGVALDVADVADAADAADAAADGGAVLDVADGGAVLDVADELWFVG